MSIKLAKINIKRLDRENIVFKYTERKMKKRKDNINQKKARKGGNPYGSSFNVYTFYTTA